MNLTENLKQSFLIKKFYIDSENRKENTHEKNMNWGIKDKLPKVE